MGRSFKVDNGMALGLHFEKMAAEEHHPVFLNATNSMEDNDQTST